MEIKLGSLTIKPEIKVSAKLRRKKIAPTEPERPNGAKERERLNKRLIKTIIREITDLTIAVVTETISPSKDTDKEYS